MYLKKFSTNSKLQDLFRFSPAVQYALNYLVDKFPVLEFLTRFRILLQQKIATAKSSTVLCPGVYTRCVQLCGQFAPGIANSRFITLLDLQLCTHALAAGGTAVLECTLQYLGSTSQGNKFSKVYPSIIYILE